MPIRKVALIVRMYNGSNRCMYKLLTTVVLHKNLKGVISLKKYAMIYKATLVESLHYIMNIIMGFITFIVVIYIFMNLWDYMYTDSSNLISGYTKSQMVWYVIITEIMWFGTGNRLLTGQLSNDIKSGTIAYGINKPYNYILFIIARYLGDITIKLFMYVLVGLLLGLLFIGKIEGFQINHIPYIILVAFLGILINAFLKMSISILSFWMEDSAPLHWLYSKMILVLGTLFPVEIFPIWLQSYIKLSPIFVINYGPAKMTIDFSYDMFIQIVMTQVIYLAVSFTLLMFMYGKGVKKLNVNGG